MRNYKILITQYESYEEFMEDIYENIDYNEVEDLIIRDYDTDEAMDLALEELINQYADESFAGIYDGQELESWWRYNGWTLDRGYGGPNYKERLADSIDWDLLFDTIVSVTDINNSFGAITLTPVEINDWVIFGYDEIFNTEEDETEDLVENLSESKETDETNAFYNLRDESEESKKILKRFKLETNITVDNGKIVEAKISDKLIVSPESMSNGYKLTKTQLDQYLNQARTHDPNAYIVFFYDDSDWGMEYSVVLDRKAFKFAVDSALGQVSGAHTQEAIAYIDGSGQYIELPLK